MYQTPHICIPLSTFQAVGTGGYYQTHAAPGTECLHSLKRRLGDSAASPKHSTLSQTFSCTLVTVIAVQLYVESVQDASGNFPGPATDVFWQFSAPAGLRSLLAWVTKRYQRPELWVTESGMAAMGEANMTREAALDDGPRLEFFRYAVCLTGAVTAAA